MKIKNILFNVQIYLQLRPSSTKLINVTQF